MGSEMCIRDRSIDLGAALRCSVEEFAALAHADPVGGFLRHHRRVPLRWPLRCLCISAGKRSVVCPARAWAHLLRGIFTWPALEIPSEILELCIGRVTRTLGALGTLSLAAIRCSWCVLVYQPLDFLKVGAIAADLLRCHRGGFMA